MEISLKTDPMGSFFFVDVEHATQWVHFFVCRIRDPVGSFLCCRICDPVGSFLCCWTRDPVGSFLCCRNSWPSGFISMLSESVTQWVHFYVVGIEQLTQWVPFLSNLSKDSIWHNIKNIDHKENCTPHCSLKDTRSWVLVFRSSGERSHEATSSRKFGDLEKYNPAFMRKLWENIFDTSLLSATEPWFLSLAELVPVCLSTSVAHPSSQTQKSSLFMLLFFFWE